MTTKKPRNPQDATRGRDVAPLRAEVRALKAAVKELTRRVKKLEKSLR